MQFAEVVPNTKTDLKTQIFTYNIPPEILPRIKIGSLVLIPFGKRKVNGIVVKIKKTKNKTRIPLKNILKLESAMPLLDEKHILLAKWMAEYYFAPLSLCIFEMIALPPKRQNKEYKISNKTPKNPTLKLCYLNPIIRLCQRSLSQKKQVIILFPEVIRAQYFFNYLQKKFRRVILYHGELDKNKRYQAFEQIKNGQADIVLGSRLALFSPLSRLGLIIITDEESETYKNERSPRYQAKTVAQKLTEITGAKLVLLSPTPSIESLYGAQKRKLYLLKPKIQIPNPETTLIDMKLEIQKGNYSPFSDTLLNILKRTEKQKEQSILFINQKGAASYIFCKNCGHILQCPNCEVSLKYNLKTNQLTCHHCGYKTEVPTFCPNCQGTQIQFRGLGTQRIENEIKKIFLKPKILRIEEGFKGGFEENPKSNPDFIVGTQKILSSWDKPVSSVAIISVDSMLNLPDFHQGEKVFAVISRLKSLAQKSFLIQTYHPENFVIQTAAKGDFQSFYKTELQNRKKLGFPPFSRLIRIIRQHKNEEKCQKEMEFFVEKLKSIIKNSSSKNITLLGPSPCFYSKIRGKYRWQIIIQIRNQRLKIKNLINLLKTLPQDWIIDIEPTEIL